MKFLNSDDIHNFEKQVRTTFINCLTGFKSPLLVGTKSEQGVDNLAVFNSVFHVGAHPPLIGMICRPNSVPRDTLENIKSTGVYTLNSVHKDFIDMAHQTSARYQPNQSEFSEVGLNPIYRDQFQAPSVEQSKLRIGLELRDHQILNINDTELLIGEVMWVELCDSMYQEDGFINFSAVDSAASVGLDAYYELEFIQRLSYAKAR